MGNFSRNTFDKLKHYVGVRLQQGVPLVDSDWNEQEDIRKDELQAFLKWFVGNGVPKGNDGFHILPVKSSDNDFIIKGGDGTLEGAGRCLVEGWDVINESDLNYTGQPLFNNTVLAAQWSVSPLPPLTTPATKRVDAVYLDVWEREVGGVEDPDLVNSAIGMETCVRTKREWVVRVAEGATSPPTPAPGHFFYSLASLKRPGKEAVILPGHIADIRRIGLSVLSEEITINNGNIGIRTNNPNYTLHVNGSATKPGGGSWTSASDKRLKKQIKPLKGALDKLISLRGISYEWKEPEKQGNLTGKQMGLIAQEVEKVFPGWVGTDPDGYKDLTIRGFEALTVEAFKELNERNENLKKNNKELERRVKALEKKLGTGK